MSNNGVRSNDSIAPYSYARQNYGTYPNPAAALKTYCTPETVALQLYRDVRVAEIMIGIAD